MNTPQPLSADDFRELVQISEIRQLFGLTREMPEDFASSCYAAKFDFTSGGPGYFGELVLLHGDTLTDAGAVVLIRDSRFADEDYPQGRLRIIKY